MNISRKIRFIILYGLPASGKTTYAKSIENNRNKIYRLDCDAIARNSTAKEHGFEKALKEQIICDCRYGRDKTYILDGLFTTNEDLSKIISIIKDVLKEDFEILVHYWDEDREACIWNDSGRRTLNSKVSIENLPYEKPNFSELEKKFGIKIKWEYDVTVKKPLYEKVANENGFSLEKGKYLYSDRWCIGGNVCDCWGGTFSVCGDEPVYFEQLDDFLKKIKPDLNFLDYNKIKNKCVSVESEKEYDYYGGCLYYNRYICDVEQMLEMLEEL